MLKKLIVTHISMTHTGETDSFSWEETSFAQSSPMVGYFSQCTDCADVNSTAGLPFVEGNVYLLFTFFT